MTIAEHIRKAIKPHTRQMVEVTITVPLSELDLSACYANKEVHTDEMHGVPVQRVVWDFDLTGANWKGMDVRVCESSYCTVTDRLQEERS